MGQMEFSANLSVARTNSYLHNGVRQLVHIDRIEPPTRSPNSEIVPTVFVSPVLGFDRNTGCRVPGRALSYTRTLSFAKPSSLPWVSVVNGARPASIGD